MENLTIPAHIAIILDGNGRWAQRRGLPRKLGHKAGCETLEFMVEDCARLGVKILTVYAFSTENWKRSDEEVGALMSLFRYYIPRLKKKCDEGHIRVKVIGDLDRFDRDLSEGIRRMEEETKSYDRMTFVIALGYGSRDELRRGMVKLAGRVQRGELKPEEITEELISSCLDTADLPDPDLIIRTSGEQRLSNFLLWQSAYAEFYFPEVLWPEFDHDELMKAVKVYNRRDRRFGGRKETSASVQTKTSEAET